MRWLIAIAVAACSPSKDTPAPPLAAAAAAPIRPNFELACVASNTTNAAQLQCVRTDTRSGDVVLVDYMRLPVTAGATAVEPGPPGRFTTACAAPSTGARADFYCVRLDTRNGELVLVNLTQIVQLPVVHK
jgi:hypothetical protein